MNLTTKGRYAVTAMVDMAVQGSSRPITLAQISERQQIALSYLEQIFMKLRKAGLVKSIRGPGGGYIFTKDCANINIAEIIMAVDEPIKMTRCNTINGCNNKGSKCVTHDLWHGLSNKIHEYLVSISLADLCNNSIDFVQNKLAAG